MKKIIFIPLLILILSAGCSSLKYFSDFAMGNQIGFPDGVDSSTFTRYSVPEIFPGELS